MLKTHVHTLYPEREREEIFFIAHPKIEHSMRWAKKANKKTHSSSTTIPNLPIAKDNSVQFNIYICTHRFDSIHTIQRKENERARE